MVTHVRFGSKADIAGRSRHVRFTPESGHHSDVAPCPLSAESGHSFGEVPICRVAPMQSAWVRWKF